MLSNGYNEYVLSSGDDAKLHPTLYLLAGLCDHELTADDGTIQSPYYPSQYQPDTSCVWTITVKEGHYVKLSFIDFDIEPYDGCKTDMLEIKDGGSKNSAMIGENFLLFIVLTMKRIYLTVNAIHIL